MPRRRLGVSNLKVFMLLPLQTNTRMSESAQNAAQSALRKSTRRTLLAVGVALLVNALQIGTSRARKVKHEKLATSYVNLHPLLKSRENFEYMYQLVAKKAPPRTLNYCTKYILKGMDDRTFAELGLDNRLIHYGFAWREAGAIPLIIKDLISTDCQHEFAKKINALAHLSRTGAIAQDVVTDSNFPFLVDKIVEMDYIGDGYALLSNIAMLGDKNRVSVASNQSLLDRFASLDILSPAKSVLQQLKLAYELSRQKDIATLFAVEGLMANILNVLPHIDIMLPSNAQMFRQYAVAELEDKMQRSRFAMHTLMQGFKFARRFIKNTNVDQENIKRWETESFRLPLINTFFGSYTHMRVLLLSTGACLVWGLFSKSWQVALKGTAASWFTCLQLAWIDLALHHAAMKSQSFDEFCEVANICRLYGVSSLLWLALNGFWFPVACGLLFTAPVVKTGQTQLVSRYPSLPFLNEHNSMLSVNSANPLDGNCDTMLNRILPGLCYISSNNKK